MKNKMDLGLFKIGGYVDLALFKTKGATCNLTLLVGYSLLCKSLYPSKSVQYLGRGLFKH